MRGVLHLERKFRDSMMAIFVLSDIDKPIPGDGEYRVQIRDIIRKLTVIGGVMTLGLQHGDDLAFGQELEIMIL